MDLKITHPPNLSTRVPRSVLELLIAATDKKLQRKVESSPGAYVLYNSRNGPPRYVGKSKDLPDRLRDWVGKYKYFRVVPTSSITAAYKKEANLYHRHGGKDDLDNEKHPPRPHKRVKCPVCSIYD